MLLLTSPVNFLLLYMTHIPLCITLYLLLLLSLWCFEMRHNIPRCASFHSLCYTPKGPFNLETPLRLENFLHYFFFLHNSLDLSPPHTHIFIHFLCSYFLKYLLFVSWISQINPILSSFLFHILSLFFLLSANKLLQLYFPNFSNCPFVNFAF